jgi:hypothetical protein
MSDHKDDACHFVWERTPSHACKIWDVKLPAVKQECLFSKAVFYKDNNKEEDKLSQVLFDDDVLREIEVEAEVEDGSTIGSIMIDKEVNKVEINFQWTESIKELGGEAEWAPTVRAHHTALELLGKLLTASTKTIFREVRILESVIRKVGRKTVDVKMQLGKLHHLINEHGSLAQAVTATLEAGSLAVINLDALQEDMDRFSGELQGFADRAQVSSELILSIIAWIWDKTNTRHYKIRA